MLAGAHPYSSPQQIEAPFTPPLTPLPINRGQQQAPAPPALVAWFPWMGLWDQQSLANSNTMPLVPPAVTDRVADSDASNHTTSDASNLTSIHPRPPHTNDPSSIIVRNISSLTVTSVGDMALPGLFYLNNVLVTPDIIQKIYIFATLLLTIIALWSLTLLSFL
jgi:hypothetical protein